MRTTMMRGGCGSGDPTAPLAALSRAGAAALLVATLAACGGGGGGSDPAPPLDPTFIDRPPPLPAARGLLPELALADHAFAGDHFSGNVVCSTCHDAPEMQITTDAGPRDVGINSAWETSMMANSTRDPYWHAVVAYELEKFPMHEDEINDTCTRCHAPMASEYARKEGLSLRLFDKLAEDGGVEERGIYSMEAGEPLFDHAMDGVSCTLCHQIDPDNLGIGSTMPESSMTGGYAIADYRGLDVRDRPAYGQYEDPDAGYMQQQASFLAQHGPHMSESETCAVCHNLNVDPIDEETGAPLVGVDHFAEQANYTEWLFSDYRRGGPLEASCQDCHMPKLDEPVKIASGSGNAPRPDFAEHGFLGANTVMQTMLRDHAGALGLPPGLDFDASIERNRAFLATAATVSIENASSAPAADGDGRELAFDVRVVNETGHRLPTGYHSRRVYLHVQVTDANGEQVFESGAIRDDGSVAGIAEDSDPASWEPHHDVITSASEVQVYQAIVGNAGGERTHSLLAGSHYLKDNRIPPKGFAKAVVTGSPDVVDSFGVFGLAMEDADFDSGEDTVSYRIRVPESDGYNVSVELRYQPLSYGHLADLFRYSDEIDQVDMFRTIYDATELRDEVIDAASGTID